MNTGVCAELIKYLTTTTKAAQFVEKIEAVLRTSAASDIEKSLQEMVAGQEYELLTNIKEETEGWRECLQSIVKKIQQVPVLQITVAIQPSWAHQQTLTQKLQNAIHESFLIKIVEKESIIGGAIIDFKGKRTDLSLQTKMQKYSM